MTYAGFVWECSCGNIEYSELAPEECTKCNNIESYIKLPEELVVEREKDMVQQDIYEEPMQILTPKNSIKKKSVKKKTKTKKKKFRKIK